MDRQYIVTERAHFMCPNMHFGILFSIDKKYDNNKIRDVIKSLSEAHPLLKCLIANDSSGKIYYALQEQLEIRCSEMNSLESLEDGYRKISESGWTFIQKAYLEYVPIQGMMGLKYCLLHIICFVMEEVC